MLVRRITLREFRGYPSAEVDFGERLTVITGPNGAGKTNLIEGLYFGCTGRSCRTANEREVVRFGAPATRVVLRCGRVSADGDGDGDHELQVGFQPGQPKRMKADGVVVERLLDVADRPLVSVFMPDRLELVKGAPALRRAHLDQFVAALWPARVGTRRAYAQALAQRNALIARLRGAGSGSPHAPASRAQATLASWDAQLARHGVALMKDRAEALGAVRAPFARITSALGIGGAPEIAYRPRSRASTPAELAAELAERVDGDLERGFTGHGPHRDDVSLRREGRELRVYGSQGQQRLALLGWLLGERAALAERRRSPPIMLLDDVMSELDAERRAALVELLRASDGQSVITATDPEQVPGAGDGDVHRLHVRDGVVSGPLARDGAAVAA